jgi:predicted nucleic acid-binding protein
VSLAVVDASVLTVFYAADDPRRGAVVERLGVGDTLVAPAHLDAEVVSALRGLAFRHPPVREVVPTALRHLAGFAIRRLPLAPLLERMWELRDTVTPYDAAYIAIAERLDAPLITCDGKLSAASGPACRFELIN